MKLIRKIATTLALCGASFFATVAHAGDCGEWMTSSFLEPWTIYVDGIPKHGQDWVTRSEWVPGVCVTPQEPDNSAASTPSATADAITFFINAVKTLPVFCKKTSETCLAWGQDKIRTTCTSYGIGLQSACNAVVGEEASLGCQVVTVHNTCK